MYCKNCGTKIADNSPYCLKCGFKMGIEGKITEKTKKYSLEFWIMIVLVVVAIICLIIGLSEYFSQRLRTETSTTSTPTSTTKTSEIPVKILELKISASWLGELSRKYEIKKAYLTSDVVDMGDFKNNYKGKDWLVIEVYIKDKRTSGERRTVKISDYLRLEDQKNKSSLVVGDNSLYLSPQEDGTVFAFFPVTKDKTSFLLLAGSLPKPDSIVIDFEGSDALEKNGWFYLKEGVKEVTKGGVNQIKVISPNGGEKLCINEKYKIEWEGTGTDLVTLAVLVSEADSTGTYYIETVPAENREFAWEKVGYTRGNTRLGEGTNFKIQVKSSDGTSQNSDTSDNFFSIAECK